mgnify:FL=1
MSNVMSVLKAEICRLAKKEAKREVAPVKKVNASYRGLIAALRRQVDAMQKELLALRRAVPGPGAAIQAKAAPEGRFWISGKGVKTLRKRMGLTQAQFGKLVGVSVPTVVNWEGTQGKVNLRKAAAGKLQGLRGIGKRQAAEMLGMGKGKAVVGKVKPKGGRKAKKA